MRCWVLAEDERLFLPLLLQPMAESGCIAGIIQIHFKESLRGSAKKFWRNLLALGILSAGEAAIASMFLGRSLKQLARQYNLPLAHVAGFDDPRLDLMLANARMPVLTQVSRRVPATLVENYDLINKHCALLPAYRGVYPVLWAMIEGAPEQGVTIHRMGPAFDTGPILAQDRVPNEGAFFSIYRTLYDLAAELLIHLPDGIKPIDPVGTPSYCSFPSAADRARMKGSMGSVLRALKARPKHLADFLASGSARRIT